METFKFGLMMSIIPFTGIFLVLTIAWALIDLSLRRLSAGKRALWSAVVIAFPVVGVWLYNSRVRVPNLGARA
jgi:uncharacterized membrane protein YhaH (DUF805 family)